MNKPLRPGPWRIAAQDYKKGTYLIHGPDPGSNRELQIIVVDYGGHPIKEHLDAAKEVAELIASALTLQSRIVELEKENTGLKKLYLNDGDEQTSKIFQQEQLNETLMELLESNFKLLKWVQLSRGPLAFKKIKQMVETDWQSYRKEHGLPSPEKSDV